MQKIIKFFKKIWEISIFDEKKSFDNLFDKIKEYLDDPTLPMETRFELLKIYIDAMAMRAVLKGASPDILRSKP